MPNPPLHRQDTTDPDQNAEAPMPRHLFYPHRLYRRFLSPGAEVIALRRPGAACGQRDCGQHRPHHRPVSCYPLALGLRGGGGNGSQSPIPPPWWGTTSWCRPCWRGCRGWRWMACSARCSRSGWPPAVHGLVRVPAGPAAGADRAGADQPDETHAHRRGQRKWR